MAYTLKPSITALFAPDNTSLVLQLLLLPLAVGCYCCLQNPLGKSARAMSCTHNRCVSSLLAKAVNQQGEDLEKNDDGDYSGKVDITTKNTSLAVCEACGAIFWPTPGCEGRTFVSSGFPQREINFSVRSAHCGWMGGRRREVAQK